MSFSRKAKRLLKWWRRSTSGGSGRGTQGHAGLDSRRNAAGGPRRHTFASTNAPRIRKANQPPLGWPPRFGKIERRIRGRESGGNEPLITQLPQRGIRHTGPRPLRSPSPTIASTEAIAIGLPALSRAHRTECEQSAPRMEPGLFPQRVSWASVARDLPIKSLHRLRCLQALSSAPFATYPERQHDRCHRASRCPFRRVFASWRLARSVRPIVVRATSRSAQTRFAPGEIGLMSGLLPWRPRRGVPLESLMPFALFFFFRRRRHRPAGPRARRSARHARRSGPAWVSVAHALRDRALPRRRRERRMDGF